MKRLFTLLFLSLFSFVSGQNEINISDTRKFIEEAHIYKINKDYNRMAQLFSGEGEAVSFISAECFNLKTGKSVKSLLVELNINTPLLPKSISYHKSSWIDFSEIDEFIIFLEDHIIPNLNQKLEIGTSTNYIFESKELVFSFLIDDGKRKVSVYLKDNGVIEDTFYFWTQSQVNKIPKLLELLKQLK